MADGPNVAIFEITKNVFSHSKVAIFGGLFVFKEFNDETYYSHGSFGSAPAYIGDAGRVVQIMEYDISKWLITLPDPYTLTGAQDWLSSLRFERGRYVWAITRDGEVIGMIGIDPTLGYWIGKEHWGQVYVREAAHAVLSAYFHDPFADPISSSYFVANEHSARVLTRLGFSPMGKPVATFSTARQGELPLQKMILTPEQWAALNPLVLTCLLYTSPSPRDLSTSRMPSSA